MIMHPEQQITLSLHQVFLKIKKNDVCLHGYRAAHCDRSKFFSRSWNSTPSFVARVPPLKQLCHT